MDKENKLELEGGIKATLIADDNFVISTPIPPEEIKTTTEETCNLAKLKNDRADKVAEIEDCDMAIEASQNRKNVLQAEIEKLDYKISIGQQIVEVALPTEPIIE